MSQSPVLGELEEAHFESAEGATIFEKEESKEEVLREVTNNSTFNERLTQSLPRTIVA